MGINLMQPLQAQLDSLDIEDTANIDGLQVDLGYRTLYISMEALQRDPLRTRCFLCCCPCCYGGVHRSVHEFVRSGAVWSCTFWFSALDLFALFLELCVGGVADTGTNPMVGPGACTLLAFQAKWSPAIVHRLQVWRLVIPIFLHAGIVHILMNLYTQVLLGMQNEFKWGSFRFAVVYIVSGVSGNLLSAVLSPLTVRGAIEGTRGSTCAREHIFGFPFVGLRRTLSAARSPFLGDR